MKTTLKICYDSLANKGMESEIADLIVTSPPYPMVAMWDDLFSGFNPVIHSALTKEKSGRHAHLLMFQVLVPVLRASERILKPGGFLCINIGDAVRSLNGNFRLYDNHSFISQYLESKTSLYQLPRILWRKTTNAPNKFMGSGTLPLKAYVTLEHEFILIFKKPGKIDKEREALRRKSSIFWEERNTWYSDVWTFQGTRQEKNGKRTAAFPFELPHRLINMFSVQGDVVVDPFLGSGTTMAAAVVNARNFLGFEINKGLRRTIIGTLKKAKELAKEIPKKRIDSHRAFADANAYKYKSIYGGVKTKQEENMEIPILNRFKVKNATNFTCKYKTYR